MAGTRGNYQDNTPKFYAEDVNQDTATFLGNDAQLFRDLCDGWNVVWSGFALTAGAGMIVNVATGVCYAGGIRCAPGAGGVTLAVGGSQPRYDVIYVQQGTAASTNTPSGQPNVTDSATFGVLQGAAANPPAKPVITQANQCQVGTVYVPANATTAAGCTLNSGDTAPNSQSIKGLVAATLHAALNITQTAVHGAQATLPGGTGANQLAQTDALGNVGSAGALWDGAARRSLAGPGVAVANAIPCMDGSGRVADSERVGGYAPTTAGGTQATSAAVTDGSGRVGYAVKADNLANAGVPVYLDKGVTAAQTVPNAGYYIFTITFAKPFTAAPALNVTVQSPGGAALPVQYGMQVVILSVSATAATVQVGQTTGFAQSLQLNWNAQGS